MYTLYGIPNCDTIKKAKQWLDANGIAYRFHDYKQQHIPAQKLQQWIAQVGVEGLLNKKSTTWRNLTAAEQKSAENRPAATKLLLAHPTLIKRPVVEENGKLMLVGFDAAVYQKKLMF